MMRLVLFLASALAVVPAWAATPTAPVPNNRKEWPRTSDVPAGLLKRGEEIRTVATIEVSSEGLPTACTITQSRGPSAIGNHACKLYVERARFRPARDEKGRPVAGSYEVIGFWEARETAMDAATSKAVRPRAGADVAMWVTTADLPKGALKRNEIIASHVLLKISATGRVAECRVPKPSEKPDLDIRVCRLMIARGNYTPALDAAGQPVESEEWRTVRWQLPRD